MFVACDESGKLADSDYLVVGSIWVNEEKIPELERDVASLRLKTGCWREVHWTSLGRGSNHYNKFCDEFMKICFRVAVPIFRAVIVNKTHVDIRKFHDGSNGLMQSKFLYLLISRFIVNRGIKDDLKIVYDSNTTETQTETRYYIKKYLPNNNILCFQPCDGHISSLLQFTDLLTSATCAVWNGTVGRGTIRDGIVELIEKKLGGNLKIPTLPSNQKNLDLWYWRPSALV